MNKAQALYQLGQSLWYDNIERRLLANGELGDMIDQGQIYGVTSNPSIFKNAIANSTDYDSALVPLANSGKSALEIFEALAVEDIQAATDLFQLLYKETSGGDGYVSLEVNPDLAHDTDSTCREAQRLWELVARPNLMVKIPATAEGIPAIKRSIAAGINVNVTLIFSLERYKEVMEAYLAGLEQRLEAGNPVDSVASVASFFVSRIDTKVDGYLEDVIAKEGASAAAAAPLRGQAAVASAKMAYQLFKEVFGSERFQKLQTQGARLQRPLWASTSTKNPAYPDTLYVDQLIGPDTINTVPPNTILAFEDHGVVAPTLESDLDSAQSALSGLEDVGISLQKVTQELEDEGVAAFSKAFADLLASVEHRRAEAAS